MIDLEKLTVWYQPIIDTKNNTLCGVEALVRDKEQKRSAYSIIKEAEKYGETLLLDGFVLDTVAADIRDIGIPKVYANIHPESMKQRDLASLVGKIYATMHDRVVIEINEYTDVYNEVVAHNILSIAQLGHKLALDDFGDGTCGIQAVIDFNFDIIKYSAKLGGDMTDKNKIILYHTQQMANELNIDTIIEHIENENGITEANSLGIYNIQGFALGKPMNKADLAIRFNLKS